MMTTKRIVVVVGCVTACVTCWLSVASARAQTKKEPALLPDLTAPKSAPASKPLTLPSAADESQRIRQLQSELDALRKTRAELGRTAIAPAEVVDSEERAQLKKRMAELMEQLKARQAPPTPQPAGPLRRIQNLFRAGEYEAAMLALQLIDPSTLNRKESIGARYLKASCYRRLGELDKAKVAYKEVAASKEDPFLAECATWQICSIEIRQAIAAQIDATATKSNSK